ncbi:MAG TPA: hypothetical protein VFS74_06375 [Gemmatimonadales bacterium]|nr:hypothetical protein [Gemmatimonadales bacterium]
MSTREPSNGSRDGTGFSRRAALMRGGAIGTAAAVLGSLGLRQRALAQEMTPMAAPAGWTAKHVEVTFVPHDPVNITLAGSGPPQRGDHFYIDAPIYARGDEAGAQIGTYQCFGAWTAAANDEAATNQRLTTVQYALSDGSIMGLINEFGTEANVHVGAVQGGTGAYTGALGTFMQVGRAAPEATPGATPAPAPGAVDATFELILPGQS